jgi:hypothetical protein
MDSIADSARRRLWSASRDELLAVLRVLPFKGEPTLEDFAGFITELRDALFLHHRADDAALSRRARRSTREALLAALAFDEFYALDRGRFQEEAARIRAAVSEDAQRRISADVLQQLKA